jgi:hypothetical protein
MPTPSSFPRTCTFVLALLVAGESLAAQQATLAECQRWKNRIDGLTDQRRGGGAPRQMEKWKRQRQDYRELFIEGGCRRYGRELE